MDHVCRTTDGVAIEVGLRVIDYDMKQGVVVNEPRGDFLTATVTDEAMASGNPHPGCWSGLGSNGHWWTVCPDDAGHDHMEGHCRGSIFDGSRLTTRGVR